MSNEDRSEHYPEKILNVRELEVEPGQSSERIDRWLTVKIAGATRNKVQEAIDVGAVTVNGGKTKSNYKVRPGDLIRLELMKPPPIELIPEDLDLDIIYEDDDVLVVNKPAGMVTHPGFGNRTGTLINGVLHHVGSSLLEVNELTEDEDDEDEDETPNELAGLPFNYDAVRPGVVHRLDKETSGVMVVARTVRAKTKLGAQFAERTIKREYRAVAWGRFDRDEGEIEGNIARDKRDRKKFTVSDSEGKYALTRYSVIEHYEFATLLALRLATGRTHQIRVHAQYIGRPLLGDPTYGGGSPGIAGHIHLHDARHLLTLINRQALHARTLGFVHPSTNEYMEFEAPMPEDMAAVIEALRGMSNVK